MHLPSARFHAILIPVLCLCVLGTSGLRAQQVQRTGTSSTGAITWNVEPEEEKLFLTDGQGSVVILCNVINPANVSLHFSPDDKYLIVTDGGSSLGIHATLYERGEGIQYKEVTQHDFDLATQRLAVKAQTGQDITDTVLDHSYLKCLGWSKDGKWVHFEQSGRGDHAGKRIEIKAFKCAFNPHDGTFVAGDPPERK